MTTFRWLSVFGSHGSLVRRSRAAKRRGAKGRQPTARYNTAPRTLSLEALEDRTLLTAGGHPSPPGSVGSNIALGCNYEWSWAPDYNDCTDADDTKQLTNGSTYTGGSQLWTQMSTVGWQNTDQHSNTVEITIDLGQAQPIQGVKYYTAGGSDDVYWPTSIIVQVSNDKTYWYDAGLSGAVLDLTTGDNPAYGTYALHTYQASGLETYGQYVRFRVVESTMVFVDEIQVFRGDDSLLPSNIAVGSSYTMSPAPGFSGCTDAGDTTQLTDNYIYTGTSDLWTLTSTVGWYTKHMTSAPYVTVTIDLGSDQPIGGVSLHTAAGHGMLWPRAIDVLVSTDNINFYNVGEVVTLSVQQGLPDVSDIGGSDEIRSFWTDRLATHGRYVKFLIVGAPYIFVDEIEVYQGRSAISYSGPPVTNYAELAATSQQHAMEIRRIVYDAQKIQTQVTASSLTAAQKDTLTRKLASYIAQARDDNPDDNIVLPIDDLHISIFAVQTEMWRCQGLTSLTAWNTSSIWDSLAPTDSPLGRSVASVNVTAMLKESRSGAFNLSNPSASAVDVKITFSGLSGGTHPSYVTVQEMEWTDSPNGLVNSAALPIVEFDAVQNAYIVHIESGMTRQVWLTFTPTAGNPGAGTFTGTVVVNGGAAGTVNVPITLRVSPLQFDSTQALSLGGWDYTDSYWYGDLTYDNRAAFISYLQDYLVDTTWSTNYVLPYSVNFSRLNAWVNLWQGSEYQYRIFLNAYYSSTSGTYSVNGHVFNTANDVATWLKNYTDHWTASVESGGQGLDLDRLAFLICDEASTIEKFTGVANLAAAMHTKIPGVQIWEDPYLNITSYGSDPAYRTAWDNMTSNCDILCPEWGGHVRPYGESYLDPFSSAGKTLNFYSCSEGSSRLDPYSYYRMQAWAAYEEGATAIFYWGFCDQGGASNWRTDYPAGGGYSNTPLFIEPATVIDGKAMNGIREGVEDYQYLQMLEDRIAYLATHGVSSADLSDAQTLLDAAPGTVLNATGSSNVLWTYEKDRNVADQVRIQVMNMLETLCSYPTYGPLATDDSFYVIPKGGELVTTDAQGTTTPSNPNDDGVLANDIIDYNAPLTAILVSGPSHGILALNLDGTFTYSPADQYNGSDSFTYMANDGQVNSNVATVTITVLVSNPYPGDANRDGTVDDADRAIVSGNWLMQTGATWIDGDFNDDQRVDDIDATLMATNWGRTLPPVTSSSAATEPVAETQAAVSAVSYDLDNSGKIDLGDLAFFASVYREKPGISTESPYAYAADYDRSGTIDLGDLAFFAANYRLSQPNDSLAPQTALTVAAAPAILPGDANRDGAVDDDDASALALNWQKQTTATFANYTSYSKGINGIMVDFDDLPGTLTVNDFEFKVGNSLTPDSWTAAAVPQSISVRLVTVGGVVRYRATIIWADNAIQKQCLQVTVKATANTGLAENDVFYYGNAIGESGDTTSNAIVNATDEIGTRNHQVFMPPATLDNLYDFNRDKLVNATDQIIARNNQTFLDALKLIMAPLVVTTDDAVVMDEDKAMSIAALSNDRDTQRGTSNVFHVDATYSLETSLAINSNNTIRYKPSVLAAILQVLLTEQSPWGKFIYTTKDSKGLADTAMVKALVNDLDAPPGGQGTQLVIGNYAATSPLSMIEDNQETTRFPTAHDKAIGSGNLHKSISYPSWLYDFDLLGNIQKSEQDNSNILAVDLVLGSSVQ